MPPVRTREAQLGGQASERMILLTVFAVAGAEIALLAWQLLFR